MLLLMSFGSNADLDSSLNVSKGFREVSNRIYGLRIDGHVELKSTLPVNTCGALLPLPTYANAMSLCDIPSIYSSVGLEQLTKELERTLGRKRDESRVKIDVDIVALGSRLLRGKELPRIYCRVPLTRLLLEGRVTMLSADMWRGISVSLP
ncbi:MAG: 2-amino-4-hydroxy-6-hydroxymethyldihydropteridine diphosphokinase [Muribaculaceae bacterium]|nr:2-amino-4-hydroxy-6-hydroxymethyldihydropteridine diphosphokinase [Muribaculaceae bacterium]